jgi:transcriptional regulator with XRE-family HTH domain
MKFSEALDKTLDDYGIAAKWLSEQSGVSMQMISNYRHGKQRVYSDSLESMISALPAQARRYLYGLVSNDRAVLTLELLIDAASEEELKAAMFQIVHRVFPKSEGTTDANSVGSRVKSSALY